jgi:hypothetical protein
MLFVSQTFFINQSTRKITLNSNKNAEFISLVEEVEYEKNAFPY